MKVGTIARKVLRPILEETEFSPRELADLQDKDYCKYRFGIDFPLLTTDPSKEPYPRYYAEEIVVNNTKFYLCSQWFETDANNDRPMLVSWIAEHLYR